MVKNGSFRLRALLLLAILAGSEAVRVKNHAVASQVLARSFASEQETGPESNFQQQGCSWSWWKQKCFGTGCQYRYMSLDTPSQWCRLSDEHMLQTGGYLTNQSQLVNIKASNFAEKCLSLGWHNIIGKAKCNRRMLQIMRATTFLAKAEAREEMHAMPKSQKQAQAQLLEDALEKLLPTGDDGDLIRDTLNKFETDTNSAASNPAETLTKLMNSTVYLLAGSDAEKEAARESIRQLHNATSATEAQMVSSNKTISEKVGPSVEEMDGLFDKGLENFEAKLANTSSTGALLQVQGTSTFPVLAVLGYAALAVVAIPVLIVAVIAVFRLLLVGAVFAFAGLVLVGAAIAQAFLFILSLPVLLFKALR